MSTTVRPAGPPPAPATRLAPVGGSRSGRAPVPVWRLALLSFLPPERRALVAHRLVHLPITIVVALQAAFSIRLNNSAFQDEALYLYTGRLIVDSWHTGAPVYSHPETFFSGAPQLYPVLAGLLDGVGGLGLARLFSLVCMLSATVAVYWTTNQLFASDRGARRRTGNHPGVYAAIVFATSASVIFLGHFATFDAPSFTALAWACGIGVWASRRPSADLPGFLGAAAVGLLCALAVLLKYSSAIDVPFVLLLPIAAGPWRSGLIWLRGVIAGGVLVAVLVGSLLTWARPLVAGLEFTTTARDAIAKEPPGHLLQQILVWNGISIGLMIVGAGTLALRKPALALLLGVGSVAAPGYQVHLGELVSLHKHLVLGLLLGAPLAGLALSRLARVRGGTVAALMVIWCAFVLGLFQSRAMFGQWPDTAGLSRQLSYSVSAMPWIRMVGDNPEPLQYASAQRTQPWQWTATYTDSFTYHGLTGIEAYRKAFKDNYFQLAFFDGSSATSATLMPELAGYGFRETHVVQTAYGAHTWHIYERYELLG